MSYTMIDNGNAIRCNDCGTASYNQNDIRHKFCARCRKYHYDRVSGSSPAFSAPYGGGRAGYGSDLTPIQTDYSDRLARQSDAAGSECKAVDDARPSSSDPVDYGSSSNDCGSSSNDSGGGWGSDS